MPVKKVMASVDLMPYSGRQWWLRPQAADRPPIYWHVASRGFALAMTAVPRKYRFGVATRFSSAAKLVMERTNWYRRHEERGLDRAEDITLHYLLNIMSNSGARYDLKLKIEGVDVLHNALNRGKGVLTVSPHSLLTFVICRFLYEIDHPPLVVAASSFVHV